uniref:Matrix metallopeptidase 20a (enamelysin) n=1 Tax=Sinocyclocheilus grahami TaxID=75366 RepID=A0A672RHK6_SINGR
MDYTSSMSWFLVGCTAINGEKPQDFVCLLFLPLNLSGFNMSFVKCGSYESCRIARYTPDLSREEVENSLRLALKIWSEAAALKFVQVKHGMVDITFSFNSKAHGDFFTFDGPGGVLAHAFEPGEGIGGDVHFDDDETWTVGRGYNLFTVAAHELGHSLGLSHSRDPTALMHPKYKFLNAAAYKLPRDDILGIQAMYGKHFTLVIPNKCDPNFSLDAVTVLRREIIFFKNREGPQSVFLPSITSPVDAAYDIPSKEVVYVFTGPKYWVVQKLESKSYYSSIYEFGFPESETNKCCCSYEKRSVMERGFPRKVHMGWPGIVGKVDAAFELNGNGLYHFLPVFSVKHFPWNYIHQKRRLLHIMNTNAWFAC